MSHDSPHARRGRPFRWAAAAILFLAGVSPAVPQRGPVATIDEDCTAFRFAPDGRVAFAVHHVFNEHKFQIQRDDFWIGEPGKSKRRILDGKLLARGEGGFSYTVRSLRWSPNGAKLTAELLTTTMEERHGSGRDVTMSFLLDANGPEIKIAGGDSLIPETAAAAWLDDESTVVYLEDESKPRENFSMHSVRPAAGHALRLFPSTLFLGVAWLERARQAVAVEAPSHSGGKPRLVLLDLAKQTSKELAVLEGFAGGLSLSPSGQRIAYFRDPGTLEARTLAEPRTAQSVQALIGPYFWAHDEQHIILKSGPDHRSGVIESIRLSDGSTDDLFHSLTFWNFDVSPDGSRIGVSPPGKHVMAVYELP
ncbi:MAG TPA: hypothetical protein VJW51_11000 [Candidatus Acidoferrales bacterium]|nr:hypothetical protein [Candidatus Acidoferrales bacterium]